MPGVDKLFKEWREGLEHGDVKVIVPFNTITEAYLDCNVIDGADPSVPRRGYLRCSAGHKAVSITTDGRVLACPVASGECWNNLGKLSDQRTSLLGKKTVGARATSVKSERSVEDAVYTRTRPSGGAMTGTPWCASSISTLLDSASRILNGCRRCLRPERSPGPNSTFQANATV